MDLISKKKAIVIIITTVLFLSGLSIWFIQKNSKTNEVIEVKKEELFNPHVVIGKSVQGRNIDAYTYGKGEDKILFVGGIHGGYEWNSSIVAYNLIDYLETSLNILPKNISVIVVPMANPDGVYKIVGKEGRFYQNDIPKNIDESPGRFNANKVDLNRNFDCKWQPKSKWRNIEVSAGSSPFSEPESRALRDLILTQKPKAVVFWHSQGGAVYASECTEGILPETKDIMRVYSNASGYPADETYDAYQTTGDADSWLARIGIPAITVELKTHSTIEWQENIKGINAVIDYYSKKSI